MPDYPYLEEVNPSVLRLGTRLHRESGMTTVLDVGCGYGALGRDFSRQGLRVWGVEREPTAVKIASSRLERVLAADLGDVDQIAGELDGRRFDILMFSDVLEHTADPESVIRRFLPYLSAEGRLVISVPNVANWLTRFALLMGRFNYKDTGVLDKTHLRFFTRRSLVQLVETCGLQVETTTYTPMIVRAVLPLLKKRLATEDRDQVEPTIISDSPAYRTYLRFVFPIEQAIVRIAPGLLAFQIVVSAKMAEVAS
jgi:2-polyprenyl-3-methyl-5-hydroxy-6-metoxy-1,4-benzoquinol methylase